ncbi:MAG: hypothetical protein K0R09_2677 [Clostridiales bacterium]|nr:hypothetical protein [Clostridiales bacterium]
MYLDELKRKLRSLKKLETTIRFNNRVLSGKEQFVWDKFFSTKTDRDTSVKYNMKQLLAMDREKIKEVFDEFFYHVYFKYYSENGITLNDLYDPNLLSMLGLSEGATTEDIKKRFRELALKYHPDKGGDSEKFIEILDIYKKLTEN